MRTFLERLADPRPMIYDGGFGSCLVDRGIEVSNTALANELYPDAGIPRLDKKGQTYYSQTPEEMAAYLPELLGEGAYLVGGCCGTRPAHIRTFRQAVDAGLETRNRDRA